MNKWIRMDVVIYLFQFFDSKTKQRERWSWEEKKNGEIRHASSEDMARSSRATKQKVSGESVLQVNYDYFALREFPRKGFSSIRVG